MQDKTITSALCQLRLQLIRSGQAVTHVDALLVQRGVDPASLHVPRQYPADSCGHGEIKLLVIMELRTGPKTARQIVQTFMDHHPALAIDVARARVWRAMWKMGRSSVAVKEGKAWRLAQ